jgi:hypothetical protein
MSASAESVLAVRRCLCKKGSSTTHHPLSQATVKTPWGISMRVARPNRGPVPNRCRPRSLNGSLTRPQMCLEQTTLFATA